MSFEREKSYWTDGGRRETDSNNKQPKLAVKTETGMYVSPGPMYGLKQTKNKEIEEERNKVCLPKKHVII